ncbi:MAG: transcription termination factor Rho [Acidobacteria bacterium]|nr:transcription termination factor Rho [Acidobacteriota bacterium]
MGAFGAPGGLDLDDTSPKEQGAPTATAFEDESFEPESATSDDGFDEDEGDGGDGAEGGDGAASADGGPQGAAGDAALDPAFRRRRRRRRRRGRNRPAAAVPASGPLPGDGQVAAVTQTDPVAPGSPVAPSPSEGGRFQRRREAPPAPQPKQIVRGIVRLLSDHSGSLVSPETLFGERGDPFVPRHVVEAEDLEDGLMIEAEAVVRAGKGPLVQKVLSIESMDPADYRSKYIQFHKGVSVDPDRRLRMETTPEEISGRVLDLVIPIGRGQRCLIVAPPKAGKTFLLKAMANAIAMNDPDVFIFMLLVDERPEEVTDMQRSIQGEVIASPSDLNAAHHIAVAEATFERAKRLVEIGKDVVIFLDSITRLSRAYNNEQRGSGKILSGGVDSRTMEKPRRFFGGARNHEHGGSLTIIATCLVDTGSRMDDVIFEEFKGTGNSEIILDRGLFERRIFPAVNIPASGTRKEEKLYDADELPKIHKLRRALASVKPVDAMELLLSKLTRFKTNKEFLKSIL